MPISELQRRIAPSIKSYFRSLGLKNNEFQVTSSPGKSQYTQARIRPISVTAYNLAWNHSIPEDDRKAMLKIIYPNCPDIYNQSCAGNIGEHMVVMNADQWVAFLQLKNIPID